MLKFLYNTFIVPIKCMFLIPYLWKVIFGRLYVFRDVPLWAIKLVASNNAEEMGKNPHLAELYKQACEELLLRGKKVI
jgi:hypothetical protein